MLVSTQLAGLVRIPLPDNVCAIVGSLISECSFHSPSDGTHCPTTIDSFLFGPTTRFGCLIHSIELTMLHGFFAVVITLTSRGFRVHHGNKSRHGVAITFAALTHREWISVSTHVRREVGHWAGPTDVNARQFMMRRIKRRVFSVEPT